MNKFGYRKEIISGIIITVCAIYILRLFYYQVIDDTYKIMGDNNSQRTETLYPARGLIYDRNGKLLVDNQAAYDLLIIPDQVKKFDTLELISILDISKEYLEKGIQKCRSYARYKPSILISQITGDKYAILQEKLYRYPGFYTQTRTLRKYNVNHSADVFGYISEVSQEQITKNPYYAPGDYVGMSGLERTYEEHLRGTKGKQIVLVDNKNRKQGSFADGEYDEEAIVGENLHTTLDIDLQEYAYQLMRNKKGGIVAIEPSTGEILVKMSSPGYDPQLMVGLERGKNYSKLLNDPLNPLFDRTTMAQYPPGSIFKTVQALIGLQTKAITPHTQATCNGGAYIVGGRFMKCHHHSSPVDLVASIENSCNPYYVNVFKRVLELPEYGSVRNAYNEWRNYVTSFGFGSKICPDFSNEVSGEIYTQEKYDKVFKTQKWYASYIISLSIGQGELLITPIQMANLAAVLANRGYYITPHIVRPLNDSLAGRIEKHQIPIDRKYYEPIVEGMQMVIKGGTGRRAQVDSITMAGKTGTVQNPHGDDHSVFIAFAPVENPKIALIVYVENGVWGSRYAAPIAGLMIEKYLKGKISDKKKPLEKEMFEANLIKSENLKNNEKGDE
ncbi:MULTISPECIES: penicillin-binding protein 2 [Butyricimonas]|uniref:penicillin-binding protein 2 n=1 Tax=Butyricimonas TaxID=574697 RepID=UPI0003691890|nr:MULTISPECIES: penicillin-binding protein 2 [Butyricimonas]